MDKKINKVTIKDIARETNLSPATVSLVLNNKPHRLSDETRRLVQETARKMNYRPNNSAVSLKTRKTKTIGMVCTDFTNAYFGQVAKGAETRCAQEGYALLLCSTNGKPRINYDYINILLDKGVDGILISFYGIVPAEIQRLIDYVNSYGIKIISVGYRVTYGKIENVALDDRMGGCLAAKYLIEKGHRRIGCITGPLRDVNGPAAQRLLGYKQALEEAHIRCLKRLVIEGDYSIESGSLYGGTLFREGATAIVAANDLCAYGIYKWARENQVRIPEDLSVVGYDDIVFSDFFNPSLSTIRQPAYDMGYKAAEQMIDICEGRMGDHIGDVIFKPELIERESARQL